MLILLGFAFLAGIVTILSPCILPLLPIILSGTVGEGNKKPFGIIVGFILSFTIFTVFSFSLFKLFGISQDVLRIVAVVILILFGLALVIPQILAKFESIFSKVAEAGQLKKQRSGFTGGLLVGLSLGLVWTPCVGPILASVIALAATSSANLQVVLIAFSYSLGTALPMLAITYGGRALLNKTPWLLRNTGKIQRAFGVLMILTAIGIATGVDRDFQNFLIKKFPSYGSGLTQIEDNEKVQMALKSLDTEGGEGAHVEGNPAPNPNFEGATKWLNSEPLTLEQLKGKVVLVKFWTYTCINCIRTFPYIKDWHEKYADDGLVIIAVHTPEFEFEKDEANVRAAMAEHGIDYTVVQDNDYKIWRSYKNRFWPAEYFIDKQGNIRRTHFGEGKYEESEAFIQKLLMEDGQMVKEELGLSSDQEAEQKSLVAVGAKKTPEIYLGYGRGKNFAQNSDLVEDKLMNYSFVGNLADDLFAVTGKANFGEELVNFAKGAKLQLNFGAKNVYMVAKSKPGTVAKANVKLGGKKIAELKLEANKLYDLYKGEEFTRGVLELEFLDDNAEVFTFTFG